ncbi:MAG: SCO family protein [Chlamydiae bacterium]|nr:SCO family protein [Chlamydiota bacterium]
MMSGVFGAFVWSKWQSVSPPLPIYGTLPDVELTERNGKTFLLSDLNGKIWIANFIFTHCGGQCPLMSSEMKRMRGELSPSDDLRWVSFTVDPQRDTPEVLSSYAQGLGAGDDWLFLTGDQDKIFNLARKGFYLGVEEGGTKVEPIMHSNRFVLVDRQGHIRGSYSVLGDFSGSGSVDLSALAQLKKDVMNLLREK